MKKRFLSMIAILALSLLAACAQTPCGYSDNQESQMTTKNAASAPTGMKSKHHSKHHSKKPVALKTTPAVAKDTKASPTIPNQGTEKAPGMFDGVKKIIQDVQSKDVKKPQ